jgi:hypothetical protein
VYDVGSDDVAHVRNLCSTYLRFHKGERVDVGWRLHFLWYLEALCGHDDRLDALIRLMDTATSARLLVDGKLVDFAQTHVTCAYVLRKDLTRMECFLFGKPREAVLRYVDAVDRFLGRFGVSDPILDKDGFVTWMPSDRAVTSSSQPALD